MQALRPSYSFCSGVDPTVPGIFSGTCILLADAILVLFCNCINLKYTVDLPFNNPQAHYVFLFFLVSLTYQFLIVLHLKSLPLSLTFIQVYIHFVINFFVFIFMYFILFICLFIHSFIYIPGTSRFIFTKFEPDIFRLYDQSKVKFDLTFILNNYFILNALLSPSMNLITVS